jgi:predicted transcriptional regulator
MKTAENISKYRNKIQIIADILLVAKKGAHKTRIMYQANLSYDLLKRYLTETLGAELIILNKDEKIYMITWKGEVFLKKYEQYCEHRAQLEEQFEGTQKDETLLMEMCSSTNDEEK